MRNFAVSLATLVVAALAVGCDGNPLSPGAGGGTAPLTADQMGGTWTLSSAQAAGQPEQPAPAGASYQLSFSDGTAFTRVDCNTCRGNLAIDGQTVTIGPRLACTLAACPTMAFENTYVSILAGDSVARVDGDALVLTSSRGVLRFRR